MANSCATEIFEMRSVKSTGGGCNKTVLMVSIDGGAEKMVYVMRTNTSPKGTIPGYHTLMQSEIEIDSQVRILKGLYEEDLVMDQLQKNYNLLAPHVDGGRLVPIARVKNGAEAETLLKSRKAMQESMDRNGDNGEAYLDDIFRRLQDGDTDKMTDPEMATLARKSMGREPIRETTDDAFLAPDYNPHDEALRRSAEYMKAKGDPKYRDQSIEDLMELVKKEMHQDLLGGKPSDSCAEIVMSNVRAIDEKLTVRALMKNEGGMLATENPELVTRLKAFETKMAARQAENPDARGFAEVASASTTEELDEMLRKVELGHLGYTRNSDTGKALKELIAERKAIEADLNKVVKGLKERGYTFHHSAKVKPTTLEGDGFLKGLRTEMQIIKIDVHETKLRVTEPARIGPKGGKYASKTWIQNFMGHFGGCGVFQRATGVYYK